MKPIPEAAETGGPFNIGDTLSVYEAAMVYAGRHPGGVFITGKTKDPNEIFRATVEDCEKFLGRDERRDGARADQRKLSWDIYCELCDRLDKGTIKPIRMARLRPSSEIDPRGTIIATADLVQLAQERRETPEFLAHLMQSPETSTGFAGRPPIPRELIFAELAARAQRGETLPRLVHEAKALVEWLKANHPNLQQPKVGTVENSIRRDYWKLKSH